MLISLFISHHILAQMPKIDATGTLNDCVFTDGPWVNAEGKDVNGGVFFSVKTSNCIGGTVCGAPIISLYHTFGENVSITLTLSGIDCNDNPTTATAYAYNLPQNKILKDPGNWHLFKSAAVTVVSCKVSWKKNGTTIENVYENSSAQWYVNGEQKQKCSFEGGCPTFMHCGPLGFCDKDEQKKSYQIPCAGGGCPPGYTCKDNYCEKDEIKIAQGSVPCTNGKCPPGYVCKDGACVQNLTTNTNTGVTVPCEKGACPPGYGCKLGTCVKGYIVPMGYIKGRVLCEGTKPVENETVSIKSDEYKYSTTTDENGNYSIQVVAEGESIKYTIKAKGKSVSVSSPEKDKTEGITDITLPTCIKPRYVYAYTYYYNHYYSGIYDLNEFNTDYIRRDFVSKLKDNGVNLYTANGLGFLDIIGDGNQGYYMEKESPKNNLHFSSIEECLDYRDEDIEHEKIMMANGYTNAKGKIIIIE